MDPAGALSAFVFGALSFVSPCVLPLLPGYLALMSGYSQAELLAGKASTRRMVWVTLLFVVGFTLVFVAIGATATSVSGLLLGNRTLVRRVAGGIIIASGVLILTMALINSPRLAFLAQERRIEVRPSRLGGWAAPLMGMAFGFGWTPCIGPVLAAILTLAASQDTVFRGMWLLFVFSMGLGLPVIAAGIGVTKVYSGVRLLQRHLRKINLVSGILMMGFGLLFYTGRISELSSLISNLMLRLGLEWLTAI